MTDSRELGQPPQHGDAALQEQLAALRAQRAAQLDPASFRALEALARRIPGQPETVRRLLAQKLQAGLADYAARFVQGRQHEDPARVRPVSGAACLPLAQLNDYLRTATAARHGTDESGEREELANVRRFRQAWVRGRALDQLEQAAARKPANAGPLNSHALVLQSLVLMRDLSPDYLRRFLGYVESLQWLEQAREKYPRADPRQAQAARKGSRRKK